MRSSGILLHPTSLPGGFGIGDLGPAALRFVEFLVAAKQGVWQVLPLGPTGFGDSPYQCFSAFAGNPLLISPETLLAEGWLERGDLDGMPALPARRVDYGAVIPWKRALLERAAERFASGAVPSLQSDFEAFCASRAAWLDDFALFMALKQSNGGKVWTAWDAKLAAREPAALARAAARHEVAVRREKILQFAFARQWEAIRSFARSHGIRFVGDMPIFVAHDSADVWAHPELFHLDARGRPTVVAGVPPDYFSATGQLWGNPLYRWDEMARRGYAWWIDRVRAALEQFDRVRIDHFIGFSRYWEIPAREKTAVKGRWRPGPGDDLLRAIGAALGGLPLIAEDLGDVTPEVEAMRDRFGLPGMKILQFAFGGDASNPFLPHRHRRTCVVYTGTHDNDTSTGWFASAPPAERADAQRYLARSGDDIAYDLVRAALSSVADTAIVPLQDVMMLGSEARMNQPGRPDGNWSWRFEEGELNAWHSTRLAEMVELYGRVPAAEPADSAAGSPSAPADSAAGSASAPVDPDPGKGAAIRERGRARN